MKVFSLSEIVRTAQTRSVFFKEKFHGITVESFKNEKDLLRSLPLTDHNEYWNQHSFEKNPLITDLHATGILFKSGGSTGNPKYSYFTSEEWKSFTEVFGWGMNQGWLDDGDRIGNLFYVGDLYASFLFINDSIQNIAKKVLQFPLTGAMSSKELAKNIAEFQITSLCGVPTSILQQIKEIHEADSVSLKSLKKIFYGGESMYPDQVDWLKSILPQIQIYSVGYASVDAGLLGFCSRDCLIDEHRQFDKTTLVEIMDEVSGEPIDETGKPGLLYITNLTRKLMPVLRYPAGDRVVWLEPEGTASRKFKILGRSEEGARVGTNTVYYEDVRKILQRVLSEHPGFQFQMLLSHSEKMDQLSLRISTLSNLLHDQIENRILSEFLKEKPTFLEAQNKKLIHPLRIEWRDLSQFEQNKRTGKMKRIIDRRK